MNRSATSYERGKQAEDTALAYLAKQGLKEIERNYRTRLGEIDLIMQHGETTVFIEVRSRKDPAYMAAIETLDKKKVRKIILASRYFIQKTGNISQSYRFDVVTLTGHPEHPEIEWIKNAFQYD